MGKKYNKKFYFLTAFIFILVFFLSGCSKTSSAKLVYTIKDVGSFPDNAMITPNGKQLWVTNLLSNNVYVYSTLNNKLINIINVGNDPNCIVFDKNGKIAYVANSESDTISVINVYTEDIKKTITLTWKAGLNYIVLSPNNKYLYATISGSGISNVAIIKRNSGKVIKTISVGNTWSSNLNSIALNSSGTMLYVTDRRKIGRVYVINTHTNKEVRSIRVGRYPDFALVNPSNKEIYVINHGSNNISVISPLSFKIVKTLNVVSSPSSIVFSQNGSQAWVTDRRINEVSVINTVTDKIVQRINVGSQPGGIAINPNGKMIYVVNGGKYNPIRSSVLDSSISVISR